MKSPQLNNAITHFSPPPHPKGISLQGNYVELTALSVEQHAEQLFLSNNQDKKYRNWDYLPYGPFYTCKEYKAWLSSVEDKDDPVFFTIINKTLKQAVGIASYLRINPEMGTIEVGHIHFSPLLQQTTAATEAMYLMMQWAFEQGYRRYEWKCNALNFKSRRAAQRLGLSFEGIFRQSHIVKGRNRDTAWFATIDKEWPKLKYCFEQFLSPENFTNKQKPIISLSSLTYPKLYKIDKALISKESQN